jgi:hypothetical protein
MGGTGSTLTKSQRKCEADPVPARHSEEVKKLDSARIAEVQISTSIDWIGYCIERNLMWALQSNLGHPADRHSQLSSLQVVQKRFVADFSSRRPRFTHCAVQEFVLDEVAMLLLYFSDNFIDYQKMTQGTDLQAPQEGTVSSHCKKTGRTTASEPQIAHVTSV